MTDRRETAALIALLRRKDRPWHHYANLVEDVGSAVAVLAGDYESPYYEPPQLFDELSEVDLAAAEQEVADWEAEGIQVVTVLDEAYPSNLRTIHNRPPLLFVRGSLHNDDRSVAVVGTRKASAEGLETADAFSRALADAGVTVVSGLAEGIDTAAHEASLRAGGRTVAVIGTGIRRTYPAKNAELQQQIAKEGAVLSQFWPDAPPTPRSFPLRNVTMSGLAVATLVVEAGDTSGARMQARFALEHNRRVFLHRSLLGHSWAQAYADRPGTTVVDSPDDVLAQVDRLLSMDSLTV